MGELLMRRREMVRGASPSITEIDWTYSMGSPQDYGITRTTSETVDAETIDSTGVKMSTRANGAWIQYTLPYTADTGWVEYVFRTPSANTWQFYLTFSNGANACNVYASQWGSGNYWSITDAESTADYTRISGYNVTVNTDFTVKIEMNNGLANVYINNSLALGNVDISTMTNTAVRIRFRSGSGNNRVAWLKSIKGRFGGL